MPIVTDEERIHTTIAGKYRIDRILARGGMGVVFIGEHTWTHRPVAVKLVSPMYAQSPEASARFLREARAAAMLRHPNAVDVLDMGQTDDGTLFLVLELLEGTDVAELLARRVKMNARESAEIIAPILDVLAVLHDKGFVHRDLKPSNVFVAHGAEGRLTPKLLDFGLVKALNPTDASRATRQGVIVGTPQYMSPEQATGARDLGHRADLWAIGAILYELTSGGVPFDGDSATATLLAIVSTNAAPLASVAPEVPEAFAKLVDSALARDPAGRPNDARTFADALRASVGLAAATDFAGTHVLVPRAARTAGGRADADTLSADAALAVTAEAPAAELPLPATRNAETVTRARRGPVAFGVALAVGIIVAVCVAAANLVDTETGAPTAADAPAVPPRSATRAAAPQPPSVPVRVAATPATEPQSVGAATPALARPAKRRPTRREPAAGGRPMTKVQTQW